MPFLSRRVSLTCQGIISIPLPLRPLWAQSVLDAHHCLDSISAPIHLHRAPRGGRSDHPHHSPKITRSLALLRSTARYHDCKMVGSLLHSSLRNCSSGLVSYSSRLNSAPNKHRFCARWYLRWSPAYQAWGKLLAVSYIASRFPLTQNAKHE